MYKQNPFACKTISSSFNNAYTNEAFLECCNSTTNSVSSTSSSNEINDVSVRCPTGFVFNSQGTLNNRLNVEPCLYK